MASVWTGAIAFGLVNIPVRVETAVRSHDLSFRLLHERGKDDLCQVKYERVCRTDGKEVPWNEIVKGYEYEKERFVVLEDSDFEKAALATSKTFEIQDFAAAEDIDPRYFEKPY
nr:Ku protein [Gemmatimonadota bacterium]